MVRQDLEEDLKSILSSGRRVPLFLWANLDSDVFEASGLQGIREFQDHSSHLPTKNVLPSERQSNRHADSSVETLIRRSRAGDRSLGTSFRAQDWLSGRADSRLRILFLAPAS